MMNAGNKVSIRREELLDAIYGNDIAIITEIMEMFGFARSSVPDQYDDAMRGLAYATLSIAAVAETEDSITAEMAMTLIDFLSPVVDMPAFLYAMYNYAYYENNDCYRENIPEKLREALIRAEFSEQAVETIEDLSQEELQSLLVYIMEDSEITHINSEFMRPLVASFYRKNIIPYCLVFAAMTTGLREPVHKCRVSLTLVSPNDEAASASEE